MKYINCPYQVVNFINIPGNVYTVMTSYGRSVMEYFQDGVRRLRYSTVPDLNRAINARGHALRVGTDIIVEDFGESYRNPRLDNETAGECLKLSLIVRGRARRELKGDAHVTLVTGTEPRFFHAAASKHCHLLVTDEPLIGDDKSKNCAGLSEAREMRRELEGKKPLLVDPSFGIVVPFKDSGYMPCDLWGYRPPELPRGDLVLKNEGVSASTFPLGINENEQLVYLTLSRRYSSEAGPAFAFAVQDEGSYPLAAIDLDDLSRVHSHEIEGFLERLRSLPLADGTLL
jgi:hypothetical protein